MKPKISIFRFVFSVITKPVSFCKNLYFWYKTDKRRKKEHLEFIKIRKSNQNKWLKVSQNIENKLNTKGYFEECDFRDMLGLNCENTITSKICDERDWSAEGTYGHTDYTAEQILKELGEWPIQEFENLKEANKEMDEAILRQNHTRRLTGLKCINEF